MQSVAHSFSQKGRTSGQIYGLEGEIDPANKKMRRAIVIDPAQAGGEAEIALHQFATNGAYHSEDAGAEQQQAARLRRSSSAGRTLGTPLVASRVKQEEVDGGLAVPPSRTSKTDE